MCVVNWVLCAIRTICWCFCCWCLRPQCTGTRSITTSGYSVLLLPSQPSSHSPHVTNWTRACCPASDTCSISASTSSALRSGSFISYDTVFKSLFTSRREYNVKYFKGIKCKCNINIHQCLNDRTVMTDMKLSGHGLLR